jgi:hypothetical protein
MNKRFWLDTNVKIKFDYIGRIDLISKILPDNTITVTGKLIGEYSNSGTVFQGAMNFDLPKQPILVISDSTFSSHMHDKIRVVVENLGCDTLNTFSKIPISDQEGIQLGLQNYILLTDDFKHIRKYENELSLTCVGGAGILLANVIKGTLSPNWAGRYYKIWQKHDFRWVPSNFSTFSELLRNNNVRIKIKKIFNL